MRSEHQAGIVFFTYVNSSYGIYPGNNKADGDWVFDPVGIISLQDRPYL